MQTFWEERYGSEEYIYGTEPNTFFRSFIDSGKPGRILLPAEGEGRNAVYAAHRGWAVTAFDYSANARLKALQLAGESGVKVDYTLAGIRDFGFPPATFDAVGLFFVHLPPPDRQYLHEQVVHSLQAGGRLVMEAFAKEQLPLTSGGPKREDMLFSTDLLEADFAALHFIQLTRETVHLQEGRHHAGEAVVVRLIAEKR